MSDFNFESFGEKQNEPYFKNNIEAYAKKASELFGQEIKPIVD